MQPRREVAVLVANALEHAAVEADEVHLVHRDDDARHAQQRHDERVALGLCLDAEPRIDEDDREIRGRRAGRHVARVLHVARRVGNDEAALARRKIAIGDVDGDALLAFGAKAIRDERQVEHLVLARLCPQRVELVVVDRAGVVQQAADQRRLAVVDAACGGEAEEIGLALA